MELTSLIFDSHEASCSFHAFFYDVFLAEVTNLTRLNCLAFVEQIIQHEGFGKHNLKQWTGFRTCKSDFISGLRY